MRCPESDRYSVGRDKIVSIRCTITSFIPRRVPLRVCRINIYMDTCSLPYSINFLQSILNPYIHQSFYPSIYIHHILQYLTWNFSFRCSKFLILPWKILPRSIYSHSSSMLPVYMCRCGCVQLYLCGGVWVCRQSE